MKYIIVVCLWFLLMSNVLWAKSYVIGYEIYDDSRTSSIFEVKKSLFKWYDDISDRVDDVYIGDLIEQEIDSFDFVDVIVTYDNNRVTLIVGDGLGMYIHGELVKESCVVKPRSTSFIQELFDK